MAVPLCAPVPSQETGHEDRGPCLPPWAPACHLGEAARPPCSLPPSPCSPSLHVPPHLCRPVATGTAGHGACARGAARARGRGGNPLTSELGPSLAPAATCGSVSDTRARPARPPRCSGAGGWLRLRGVATREPRGRAAPGAGRALHAASHWAVWAPSSPARALIG